MKADVVIDAKKLVGFLEMVGCHNAVFDCLLVADQGLLTTYGCSINQEIVFDMNLKCLVNNAVEIPVVNIERFIKVLKRFDGEIGMSYSEEVLTIKAANKKATLRCPVSEQIDSVALAKGKKLAGFKLVVNSKDTINEYDFGVDAIDINSSVLESLQEDARVFDTVNFHFISKEGRLICKITKDEDSFVQTICKKDVFDGIDSKYGEGFSSVVNVLRGDVQARISSGTGVCLSGVVDDCEFRYFICEAA